MITENAQTVIKKLVERFENGDISPVTEIAILKLTRQQTIPSSRWSFMNQVLAIMQTGQPDCRGFRQWEEAHRHVVKGAHAAYILGPITIKDKETDTLKLVGFKSIPVFPISMTEGEPIPPPPDLAPQTVPPLADVAHSWGISVSYVPCNLREYGHFNPRQNEIHLASHDESVFFHELAHAAHARITQLKGGQDPQQETVAEFTAAVLMSLYGLRDQSGNTWQYIQYYNPSNPIAAITTALDTITQVIDLILETANQLQPATIF